MTFSVSPSVTVKEVDATAIVPAVADAPGAIAGVFRWGPVLERVLVSSEEELWQRFGKPTANNAETFFAAADFLAYSNALYVVRANNGANTANSTNFTAKYPGSIGNAVGVSFVDANSYSLAISNEATGNVAIGASSFVVVSEGVEFLSEGAGSPGVDYLLAQNDIFRVGNNDVGFQDLIVNSISVAVSELTEANTTIDVYTYTIGFKNRYTLAADQFEDLDLERVWGFSNVVEIAPTAGHVHTVVYDNTGEITGTVRSVLEIYNNVSLTPGSTYDDGTNNYIKEVLENQSSYVAIKDAPNLANYGYEALVGGTDGASESTVALGALAGAWDKYKEASEIDVSFLIVGKAINASLPNYIVANIAEYRKDCVALISPSSSTVVGIANPNVQLDNVLAFRNQIQPSSYWVMDTGYKYRYDRYNDTYRWTPLNGDVAGLMARIDPWESPAGYKRGGIKNAVKLAFNPNKAQRDVLYGKDINPVITQSGQGNLLFGDKTGLAQPQSAFSRINVRRLFITVEKAIATVSQSFLFDFNDEFTQAQFVNMVEPFLRDIQGKRGIIDFRVVCDETINTPDVIDRNMFRANIFIKPARTINYIELTFVATRTGVEFEELVGQQF